VVKGFNSNLRLFLLRHTYKVDHTYCGSPQTHHDVLLKWAERADSVPMLDEWNGEEISGLGENPAASGALGESGILSNDETDAPLFQLELRAEFLSRCESNSANAAFSRAPAAASW
jgi:hypothetical protein